MTVGALRRNLSQFLRFSVPDVPAVYNVDGETPEPGYRRQRITCTGGEGDPIPAFLLVPDGRGIWR